MAGWLENQIPTAFVLWQLWQWFQCHPHTLHLRNNFFHWNVGVAAPASQVGSAACLAIQTGRGRTFSDSKFFSGGFSVLPVWWFCRFLWFFSQDQIPNTESSRYLKSELELHQTAETGDLAFPTSLVSVHPCWGFALSAGWGHTETPGVWSLGWRFRFSRWFSWQSYLSLQKARLAWLNGFVFSGLLAVVLFCTLRYELQLDTVRLVPDQDFEGDLKLTGALAQGGGIERSWVILWLCKKNLSTQSITKSHAWNV